MAQPLNNNTLPLVANQGDGTHIPLTAASNVTTKFREAFENYNPIAFGVAAGPNDRWRQSKAAGDIAVVDGNAIASSYLDLSLDPHTQGTETVIESVAAYGMPLELSFGAHLSQRTLGQEFSIEVVDTGTELAPVADLAISSLSQATTTLTVVTSAPHGLVPGKSIGIRGFADSRVNYSALVVASIPNATTFTATAGPGGNIPSLTVGPLSGGFVYFRERLGRANEGTSMIFESPTVTNASIYIRSESGDALPSGTATGNHSAAILTTASVQAINSANTYAFQPTNEYRLRMMADRLRWTNAPVDTNNQETAIGNPRTQVIPSPDANYKLRIRATNNKSLTVPVAKIVSAVKSGTTTATIVTATPHGLTTADFVNIYGIRDQAATSFPNLTVATAVASVVDATTFTIIIGTAGTVTSYGGYVSRVNGGQVQQGAITQVIQSVTRTANILTLVGNASWSGFVIGDYINLTGVRDNVAGADLGVDGAYRVRNIATTTLEVEPITGFAPTGTDIVLTNCGGAVIKRTCLRLSFIRVFDFERARFEMMPVASGDIAGANGVNVQNTPAVTFSGTQNLGTVTTVSTVTTLSNGQAAHDAVIAGSPHRTAGRAVTANYTAVASGDVADYITTTVGAQVMRPNSIPELEWQSVLTITNTTSTAIQAAAGVGLKRYMTNLVYQNTNATATVFNILRGTTVIATVSAPASMANPVSIPLPTPLQTAANEALNVQAVTTGANLIVNAQGYTAP